MAQEKDEPKRLQYPLDSGSYKILDEIGIGVSAIVYKAECVPMNSTLVAIKAIDLDRSRANFDNIRRETKTMSLLSHPNILNAHCSFTVDRRLWVVMPFMSGGSLQSIISSSFPDGFSETCIAVVLKETLSALSYLHNQGHLHRDIKAGNILIDSNGSVKLADFGVSASIYESSSAQGWYGPSASSSPLMLTDITGTPYWMAPEVIHSHTGYSYKADIWSFGITALELAHGRPPLSHLPLSKSLIMKITKRFRFSDYEKHRQDKHKKFSKAFKDMVASCLDQDPSKRPSAEKLLKHSFFKNCKGLDFLVKNVLHGLPSIEKRFKVTKILHGVNKNRDHEDDDDDDEGNALGEKVKQRRISGWNFNEEGLQMDPVFPTESNDDSSPLFSSTDQEDDFIVKQVRFGGESIIQQNQRNNEQGGESGESGNTDESNLSSPAQTAEEVQVGIRSEDGSGARGIEEGIDRDAMLSGLIVLRTSLDEQRQRVSNLIALFGGEVTREDQLLQMIDQLRMELEIERQKNLELKMELEFLQLSNCGEQSSGGPE